MKSSFSKWVKSSSFRASRIPAPTAGTHPAPTTDVAPGHAVPRNVTVRGLEFPSATSFKTSFSSDSSVTRRRLLGDPGLFASLAD